MGGKRKNNWTNEADQALIKLIKIYGQHKWAEITRQLKLIYGFDFQGPNVVSSRWNRINPNIDKSTFSREDEIKFFLLVKKNTNNWNQVQKEMQTNRSCNQLRGKYFSIFRRAFRKLNNVMGKQKEINKNKIEKIKPAVFMKILNLSQDLNIKTINKNQNLNDDLYLQVVNSCKKLFQLIETIYTSQIWEDRARIYDALSNLTTKDEFQMMLEHIFLLNTMHQIEHQMIIPIEIKQQIGNEKPIDKTDARSWWSKPKGNKLVTTWNDALSQAEDTQSEYDEEIVQTNKDKFDNDQQFSQQDISLLKESGLYQRLFQNERKQYYDWYNLAVQPKSEDRQYSVTYEQILEEQGNKNSNEGNRQKKKRKINGGQEKQQGLKSMKQQKQKIEPLHMRVKRNKLTFRDRYTMFRDEDHEIEQLEEEKQRKKNELSLLFQEMKKGISNEFDQLFGL